jgi:hypothetical protein
MIQYFLSYLFTISIIITVIIYLLRYYDSNNTVLIHKTDNVNNGYNNKEFIKYNNNEINRYNNIECNRYAMYPYKQNIINRLQYFEGHSLGGNTLSSHSSPLIARYLY